jgi:hypothetical protein
MMKSHEEGQRTDPVQDSKTGICFPPTLARKTIMLLRVIKLHNQLDGT